MERNPVEQSWASALAQLGVFGVAYFAGAELGHVLSYQVNDQTFASFWPPAGIFLATLVLTHRLSSWPAIVLVACVANLASDVLLHDKTVPVSLGFCTANSVSACIGAWLLRRFAAMPLTLTHIKDVLALAGLAAVISSSFGATIGAAIVTYESGATSYGYAWRTWWISDALAIMVVAPVVFTWADKGVSWINAKQPWRIVESAALFAGLIVICEGVYGDFFPPPYNVPIFVLPFLLWSAVRLNPSRTAVAMLVAGLIGLWNTSAGGGPYAVMTAESSSQMLRAQGTLAVLSLSVWLLAAAVAERRHADQARLALIAELQQALAEIKTLRGLIPMCAWCKKIRDDKDHWHSIEDYLVDHTEARLTHGMCPDCYANAIKDLPKSVP